MYQAEVNVKYSDLLTVEEAQKKNNHLNQHNQKIRARMHRLCCILCKIHRVIKTSRVLPVDLQL